LKHRCGDAEKLRNLGFGATSTSREICLYFREAQNSPHATSDPHYLLHSIQLSRSQVTIKELEVNLDGKRTTLIMNRAYCSGVKVCAGEGCDYTVSTKQKTNRCKTHRNMALQPSGPGHAVATLFIFTQKSWMEMADVGLLL